MYDDLPVTGCLGAFGELIVALVPSASDVSNTTLLPLNMDLRYGGRFRENLFACSASLSFAELPHAVITNKMNLS
jgi:hypothetical protein